MLKRIISAAVALPLFLVVIYFCPLWVMGILLTAICGLSAYEFVWTTGLSKNLPVLFVSVLFSAIIPWIVYFGFPTVWVIGWIGLLLFVLFSMGIFNHDKVLPMELISCFFSAGVFPLCLSLMLPILQDKTGKYLILMPFIAAWMSDTCAYFGGTFFGKHKLAPAVSPKKTWEGSVIGFIGACLFQTLYGIVLYNFFSLTVNFYALIIFGLLGAIVGQIGDLALSYVKRSCGIKDYGNIIPGHGGILDRFDSVIFILPFFYFTHFLFTILS